MSVNYTVITYGGGRILTEIFNGIAAAVGTHTFSTLVWLVALMGFVWVMCETVFKQKIQLSVYWFIGAFVLYNLLLVPKVTVQVEDKVNPGQVNIIQHVPWGLAEIASTMTQVFYAVTKMTESVYSLPDDLRYSQSGSIMASTLVNAANRFAITDPTFASNVHHFMQQCVFYDLLLGKYSTRDLFTAEDLWGFMTQSASPARAFQYNQTIVTCAQGAKNLTKDWQKELKQAGYVFGSRFFPNNTHDADKQLLAYLPISYSYLTGISRSATQLMQQMMVKNAVDQSLIDYAGQVGAQAALQQYAFTRSQQTKRSLYVVAGMQAGYWLPIMKVVFDAILFGAFLFLGPLMLMPFGVQILKNYAYALLWVQSWAPLYAILNLVMTLSAKIASISATVSTPGHHALTMMTLPGLAQANHDMAALAGYLSVSVPVIAYYITKGGAMGFMSLAQYVGGAIQSSASHGVQEATSGNISLGNTSIDNASAFNTNANHFDSNARVFSGAFSTQLSGGSQLTITSGGEAILDNRGAISSLGTSINLAESLRSAYTQQADHATSTMMNDAHAYSASMSDVIRGLYDLSSSQGITEASGHSSSVSTSGGVQSTIGELHQLTDRFAQEHHISHSQASQVLGAAYLSGHVGLKGNRSLEGKILGALTGLEGGVDGGVKGERSHTSTNTMQETYNAAKEFTHNTNFSDVLDKSIKGVQDHSFRSNSEQGERLVSSINSSLDHAEQARHDMSAQFQQAQSYRDMANLTQENALSINANATQPFLDWMKHQSAPGGSGAMGMESVEYIMANRPELAQEYATQWSQQESTKLAESFTHQSHSASAKSLAQSYTSMSKAIPSYDTLQQRSQLNNQYISDHAQTHGLGNHNIIDSSAALDAQHLIDHSTRSISDHTDEVNKKGSMIQIKNEGKLGE